MFLLDTNVLAELRKVRSGKAHGRVAAWIRGAPAGNLFLSVIVIQELEIGVLLAERRDRVKGALLLDLARDRDRLIGEIEQRHDLISRQVLDAQKMALGEDMRRRGDH